MKLFNSTFHEISAIARSCPTASFRWGAWGSSNHPYLSKSTIHVVAREWAPRVSIVCFCYVSRIFFLSLFCAPSLLSLSLFLWVCLSLHLLSICLFATCTVTIVRNTMIFLWCRWCESPDWKRNGYKFNAKMPGLTKMVDIIFLFRRKWHASQASAPYHVQSLRF